MPRKTNKTYYHNSISDDDDEYVYKASRKKFSGKTAYKIIFSICTTIPEYDYLLAQYSTRDISLRYYVEVGFPEFRGIDGPKVRQSASQRYPFAFTGLATSDVDLAQKYFEEYIIPEKAVSFGKKDITKIYAMFKKIRFDKTMEYL